MAITGVANLAVKVRDIEDAVAFYRRAGAVVTDPEEWRGAQRADVQLGALQITLFTWVIYEGDAECPTRVSSTSRCSATISTGNWRATMSFGAPLVRAVRRVASRVDAPGEPLEFMEQLENPL